ncbi:MAG: hypothetical protein V3V08_20405 [Nannocystaceae bacterium]
MAAPTSTDELALMVETLVRDYVAQAHAAAVAGATRGLEHHHHEAVKSTRDGAGKPASLPHDTDKQCPRFTHVRVLRLPLSC